VIRFHGQQRDTVVDDLGKWTAWLKPEAAGGPYKLSIETAAAHGAIASSRLTLTDILVGDVWLASGQSNMQMPLRGFASVSAYVKNGAEELENANVNGMRLLHVERKSSYFPVDDITSSWSDCTKQNAADFSAIAYFFGRDLRAQEHVPIGVIDATWGRTPIYSWLSMDRIGSDARLMPILSSWSQFSDTLADRELVLAREKRDDITAEKAGRQKPEHPWHEDGIPSQPASLYNGMIAPLTRFAIKGVIWYQGETETHSDPALAINYTQSFAALIEDWRAHWRIGSFPFLYVQISSFSAPLDDEAWGAIRDAQRRVLSVNNTAMIVTLDIGERDNVHPGNKQTVGTRLAVAASALAYGRPDIEYSGPLFRQAVPEGCGMRIWFDHAASGLVAHGRQLEGFELAGIDGRFVSAIAQIEGSSIFVRAAAVSTPTVVRYEWRSWTPANLFNRENLPASTFTSKNLLKNVRWSIGTKMKSRQNARRTIGATRVIV
jgi:sialate O-acetylesterase